MGRLGAMKEILKQISNLVERFERNIEAYRSPAYNETQLRIEFIDPFFEALGWDVTNKAGYAEQEGREFGLPLSAWYSKFKIYWLVFQEKVSN